GKSRVASDVLESDLALVRQQRIDAGRGRVGSLRAAEINPKRPAMGQKVLDVENPEPMLARQPVNGDHRKIREMLVVNGIELIVFDEPLKVRKLQSDHAVGGQQVRHSGGEIIEIRHLCQNVVADHQVCAPSLGDKLLREPQAEELDQGGNSLLAG